jgi:hypothetical protein
MRDLVLSTSHIRVMKFSFKSFKGEKDSEGRSTAACHNDCLDFSLILAIRVAADSTSKAQRTGPSSAKVSPSVFVLNTCTHSCLPQDTSRAQRGIH